MKRGYKVLVDVRDVRELERDSVIHGALAAWKAGRCAGGRKNEERLNAMKKVYGAGCPCGGMSYAQCCERLHQGAPADTAEQLMRSRYSAYVRGLMAYVHQTWHASTRPSLSDLTHDPAAKWLGLEVKRHQTEADEATVEFVARYKLGGRAHRLHETSRFVRENGRWFYVDGCFTD